MNQQGYASSPGKKAPIAILNSAIAIPGVRAELNWLAFKRNQVTILIIKSKV